MIDFSSALYLGFRHASQQIPAWDSLTLGKPAALQELPAAAVAASELAALTGCERALFAPSTLHAFLDLFELLAGERVSLFIDSGVYSILRWSIERAGAKGVQCLSFPHFDVATARSLLRTARGMTRPVIVTDGFCPACGRAAPIGDYLDLLGPYGGRLVMDDTQALGILGHGPGRNKPYGMGGGGSLRFHGVTGAQVWYVSSLAKAFGAPVAMVGASAGNIARLREESPTRVHCSPPSAAVIQAARAAVWRNASSGDALRQRLRDAVGGFRTAIRATGLSPTGGWFPVQTIGAATVEEAYWLHSELLRSGVRTVVLRPKEASRKAAIGFMITAAHTRREVDNACLTLARVMSARLQRKGASTYGSGVAI